MEVKYYRWAGEPDVFCLYGFSVTWRGSLTVQFTSPQVFVEVEPNTSVPDWMKKDVAIVFLRPLGVKEDDMACPFYSLSEFERISEEEVPVYMVARGEICE